MSPNSVCFHIVLFSVYKLIEENEISETKIIVMHMHDPLRIIDYDFLYKLLQLFWSLQELK